MPEFGAFMSFPGKIIGIYTHRLSLQKGILWLGFLQFACLGLLAQTCPVNIDFENGNLDGWTCYEGRVADGGGINVFTLNQLNGPMDGRHTIIPAGSGIDPYGGFSMSSPNGSSYSIKLGNDMGGGEAEAVSYEFTIPANRNTYSLVYYYAVVFQDPNHQIYEQPRMEIEITNLSDNNVISCASFSFVPFGTGLPGFFESLNPGSNTPVWCKDWTPVTINLDGNAGKTIRMLFRTGDCTFRRHFGYAYIDVDTDCSGEFVGASFCAEDPEVTVSAPFGFQRYTWFSADMSRQLGTGQNLTLRPPPPPGTTVNVKLEPFPGFGCPQTLTARLEDNLDATANAGPDTVSCNLEPVRIGTASRPGLVYSWSPTAGIANPNSGTPLVIPPVTTNYVLTVRSPGGGCASSDTVRVVASNLGNSLSVIGKPEYCIGSGDSALLQVSAADTIRWFKNDVSIPGENSNSYRVTETGNYNAFLHDQYGCSATTPNQPINISTIPNAAFTLNNASQCLVGNQFNFTNTSTNAVGAMQYRWDFGAASSNAITANANFSYAVAGNYVVRLNVNTNSVCADSVQANITVYPNAVARFSGAAACINLPFQPVNLTDDNLGSPVNYRWDLGNGQVSTQRQPPPQTYTRIATVPVSLSVFTDQCPTPLNTLTRNVVVERPAMPLRYPTAFAIVENPTPIQARSVGVKAEWSPGTFLNGATGFNQVFRGTADKDYQILITSAGGCTTVDSLLVQIIKQADIYVASGFTPNGDGLNDFLRPILMGIQEIKYFRIFNRWGQLVFESRNDKPGWDGRIKGVMQGTQSYVWMVEGVGVDGTVVQKRGTSVLIR